MANQHGYGKSCRFVILGWGGMKMIEKVSYYQIHLSLVVVIIENHFRRKYSSVQGRESPLELPDQED